MSTYSVSLTTSFKENFWCHLWKFDFIVSDGMVVLSSAFLYFDMEVDSRI